jgi:hypothetical protein
MKSVRGVEFQQAVPTKVSSLAVLKSIHCDTDQRWHVAEQVKRLTATQEVVEH